MDLKTISLHILLWRQNSEISEATGTIDMVQMPLGCADVGGQSKIFLKKSDKKMPNNN